MRTDPDVHKSDVSFQVHPNRLTLSVKGDPLLSGDLPEAVNIDGMIQHAFMQHTVSAFLEQGISRQLYCMVQAVFGSWRTQRMAA